MEPTNYDHVKIRTAKSWQGKNPFYVFQSNFSGLRIENNPIKKFFLILDTRQESFGINFSLKKPESLVLQGGMVNQVRKHCKGATIADILKDHSNGNLWLQLFASGQEWHIRLAKSRPPEMALINPEGIAIMRMGMKGTFTKKKDLDESPPSKNPNIESIKGDLIQEFLLENLPNFESDEDDSDDEIQDIRNDLSKEQRVLVQKLKRKLKTYRKSLEKQEAQLPTQESVDLLVKKANLLQSFGYLVHQGDFQLKLPAEITGEDRNVEIELDPDESLGANIEAYFIKGKKAKKSILMGSKVIDTSKKDIAALENVLKVLSVPQPLNEVERFFSQYKLPKVQESNNKFKEANTSKPYRTFLSSTGHEILVGKGPRENDELTKSAKTNDYWLHTSSVAGSHVIIPSKKDIREALPSQLLKEGAMLAIHYSKLRSDLAGEIYIARRSEIKKQKGMPPGLWNVERCKTMFFRYSTDELKTMLDRLQA